jgi:outer membrane protein OmpA-like peptidoglycan-associated protein
LAIVLVAICQIMLHIRQFLKLGNGCFDTFDTFLFTNKVHDIEQVRSLHISDDDQTEWGHYFSKGKLFFPNADVSLIAKDGSALNTLVADSTGNYTFQYLSPTTDYMVVANKEGYGTDSLSVSTKENENVSVEQFLRKVKEERPIVEVFEPKDVLFNFDSFEITPKSARELDKLITVLKDNKGLSLKIASHTDAIGPKAYNKYLSEKRAKSTKAYLIAQGIDESRIISAIGHGEERLLNDCSDGHPCAPAQHHLNRRSEFILISE